MQEPQLNRIAVNAFRALFSSCPDFCNLQSTFYGWVAFLATEKRRVVIKFCRQAGRLSQEINSLNRLRSMVDCKVPEILFFGCEDGNEFIVMEWVEGVPANELPNEGHALKVFSEHFTDILINMHNQPHDEGFEIAENKYDSQIIPAFEIWMDPVFQYVSDRESPFSTELKNHFEKLWDDRQHVLEPMNEKPSFVHDDCHLANVLFDAKTFKVAAILDPADAGIKHREFDVFHLNDIRPELDLIARYVAKYPLAEGYEMRRWYLSLWDDAKHASNIGWYDEQSFMYKLQEYHGLSKRTGRIF
ncbi:phosphotransferase [Photobacterium sp. WH77]|uniref:phosphotransferase n=1 Tax=unclassified Photobacterium TaxID=2628852 RepID=UPI001EDA30CE|nr:MULTISPECIES: phosphotransferase [unclassified Photobacterium]MCG2838437.1 phosphotransferase [Photobacterium sp. WH77]MCG2846054.1 phosphotransferase [Photobacterium sp. WH80]